MSDHDELENRVNQTYQAALNDFNDKMGAEIDQRLQQMFETRVGFALMIFNFNGGVLCYMSNAKREDMTAVLKEFLDRWEKQAQEQRSDA